MRTLAKAQEDLTDYLAQHVLVVQRLKRLVPRSQAQSRLLKNYIRVSGRNGEKGGGEEGEQGREREVVCMRGRGYEKEREREVE